LSLLTTRSFSHIIRAPPLSFIAFSSLEISHISSKPLGFMHCSTFTPEEEEAFLTLSRDPNVYDRICRSIAPSIYGNESLFWRPSLTSFRAS
jgi:DNA replicative helicase MCM subunit Mcm2 (Cdc46/Mcm family)